MGTDISFLMMVQMIGSRILPHFHFVRSLISDVESESSVKISGRHLPKAEKKVPQGWLIIFRIYMDASWS